MNVTDHYRYWLFVAGGVILASLSVVFDSKVCLYFAGVSMGLALRYLEYVPWD